MNYCCKEMKGKIEFKCERHTSNFNCPDFIIMYIPEYDEYSIVIHDGGMSGLQIKYCPWCGMNLPVSKRDLWFKILEKLGFSEPFEQDIPKEFLDSSWYTSDKYIELIKNIEFKNIN